MKIMWADICLMKKLFSFTNPAPSNQFFFYSKVSLSFLLSSNMNQANDPICVSQEIILSFANNRIIPLFIVYFLKFLYYSILLCDKTPPYLLNNLFLLNL